MNLCLSGPLAPELYLSRNEGFTTTLDSHAVYLATDLLGTTSLVDTLEAEEATSWSSQEEHWPEH